MKIILLTNSSSGLFLFRADLIRELQKQHEVIAAAPMDKRVDELKELGCKLINTKLTRRGKNVFSDILYYKNIYRIIRDEKPDLLITYTIKPNIYGGLACKKMGIPYAANVSGLGTAFEKHNALFSLAKRLYKIALAKARVVFFENQSDCDSFLQMEIIRKEQAHVLHGAGVNLNK